MSAKTVTQPVGTLEVRLQRVLEVWHRAPELPDTVPTKAAEEECVTQDPVRGETPHSWQEAWNEIIEVRLREWERDPCLLEDEGIEAPTALTIQRAIQIAQASQRVGMSPPDSVVPDANGGIVFEKKHGDIAEVIHVWEDGNIEYRRFRGTRLVERFPL